jgi:hypothetical protein
MPYLAFDLDAKKRAARAAAGLGVHAGQIAWGLLELWEHAWEAKSETVDALTLSCCFGPDPRVPGVLEAMGFVARGDDGLFRVRGADRYLRITEARSEAGKARAASAKRDSKGRLVSTSKTQQETGSDQLPTSTQPALAGDASSGGPALSPSTEHRDTETPSAGAHARESSPTSSPVQDTLIADAEETGVLALKAAWNELTTAPLPRWERTPKDRRIRAANALKRRPLAEWREVFARIERSSFLRGESERGWIADVDWALRPAGAKPEPAAAVLEGKFERAGGARSTGPPSRGRATEADKDWSREHPTVNTAYGEEWDFGSGN